MPKLAERCEGRFAIGRGQPEDVIKLVRTRQQPGFSVLFPAPSAGDGLRLRQFVPLKSDQLFRVAAGRCVAKRDKCAAVGEELCSNVDLADRPIAAQHVALYLDHLVGVVRRPFQRLGNEFILSEQARIPYGKDVLSTSA